MKEKVSSGQMTEVGADQLLKQLKDQQETEKEQVSGHLEAEELEELHKVTGCRWYEYWYASLFVSMNTKLLLRLS